MDLAAMLHCGQVQAKPTMRAVALLRLRAAKVARVAVAFRFQAAQVRRAQAAR